MAACVLLLALCAVCSLSIALKETGRAPISAAPAVTLCTSMVYFSLAGCLGVLRAGGWLYFTFAAFAAVWLGLRRRGAVRRALQSPGFVLFAAGGAFFILLFAIRQPMLHQWDEFTFWGSAAKAMCRWNEIYVTAPNNMVTASYPPGLPALVYLFQFFAKGFVEWGAYAAYDILALACMACVCGEEKRADHARSVLLLAACALLPLFFDRARGSEAASTVYLNLQADLTLGLLFGAALCVYYGQKRSTRSLLQVLAILAALALTKDMGMALGLIATGIIAVDMLVCGVKGRRWLGLPGFAGLAAVCAAFGGVAVAGFFGWSVYVGRAAGENRFDLGNTGGESLGMVQMMVRGVKELLGIGRTERFGAMVGAMNDAFLHRRICLAGAGVLVAGLVLAILALAFVLGDTPLRRRVVSYGVVSALGFAAFWVFHLFLYLYVFKGMESAGLKDYERYFMEWYLGWLLGAMALLCRCESVRGRKMSGLAAAGLLAAVGGMVLLRGQTVNNFATASDTVYAERLHVKARAEMLNEVLEEKDRVYLVCQGNDGTRWYYYGYELDAALTHMYGGGSGAGADPWHPTTAVTLTGEPTGGQQYEAACREEDFVKYLKACGATVLLADRSDDFVAGMLEKYTDGPFENSGLAQPAAYRITWPEDRLRLTRMELEEAAK